MWVTPNTLFNPSRRITPNSLVKGCLRGSCEIYGRGPYADRAWKVCDVLIGFSPAGCILI
jgi:hypothetical protein